MMNVDLPKYTRSQHDSRATANLFCKPNDNVCLRIILEINKNTCDKIITSQIIAGHGKYVLSSTESDARHC